MRGFFEKIGEFAMSARRLFPAPTAADRGYQDVHLALSTILKDFMTGDDRLPLLDLLSAMTVFEGLQRHQCALERPRPVEVGKDEAEDLVHWLHWCMGTYGTAPVVTAPRGLGKAKEVEVKGTEATKSWFVPLLDLVGVDESDVLDHNETAELYRPAYVVALDRSRKRVVLACRGTQSGHDVLTDIVAVPEPIEDAVAHRGILQAAHGLATSDAVAQMESAVNTQGFEPVLVGHSLGAGTVTALGFLLRKRLAGLRVVAFAPPCTLSKSAATSEWAMSHVTSVVNGSDIVPRLTKTAAERLVSEAEKLCERTTPVDRMQAVLAKEEYELFPEAERDAVDPLRLPSVSEEELVVAGRILHLINGSVVERRAEEIAGLRLDGNPVTDHFATSYEESLFRAVVHEDAEQAQGRGENSRKEPSK